MARDASGKFLVGESGNSAGRPRKQVQRRDGWISEAAGHGTSYDRKLLARYGVDVVTDMEALQLWRSNWIAKRVIEKRPSEAYRRGYEIKLPGKNGKKLAEAVTARAEDIFVDAKLVKLAQYTRAYGGGALLPVLDGAIGDWSQPLHPDATITKVRAFHVLEPRQLQPVTYYGNLDDEKMGQPETWRFMPLNASRSRGQWGQIIHESRLIISQGLQVSTQTQPGQREGWGDNEVSSTYEALRDYGLSWANATTILHNFGRDVLQIEKYAELMAEAGGEAAMSQYLRTFEMASSTLRVGVLDGKDKFTPRGGSLAGLGDTLVQQAQYVAGACEMPLTVLLGMSPGGLNATGDMDIRNWYASIENDQKTKYKTPTEQVYSLLLRAQGEQLEPDVWSVEFRPLTTPTELEQAQERKVVAETDQIYVDMKAATPVMVAKSRWGGDTYSSEMQVDIAEIEAMEVESAELVSAMAENAMLPAAGEPEKPGEDDDSLGGRLPEKAAPAKREG